MRDAQVVVNETATQSEVRLPPRRFWSLAMADDEVLEIWKNHADELEAQGRTDIFGQNDSLLAQDSGLNDVKNLMNPFKYLTALVIVVSAVSNVYAIVASDVPLILVTPQSEEFLVTRVMGHALLGERSPFHLDRVVPLCELFFLASMILIMLRYLFVASCIPLCRQDDAFKHFIRWSSIATFFWEWVPRLLTFSCMKLLYHVTPSVASNESYVFWVYASQHIQEGHKLQGVGSLVWYVVSRAGCLVLGFDAFLVKFRAVEVFVNSESLTMTGMVCCAMFLLQVVSVVNLNVFVRDRLFLFLFAGEDGKLDIAEHARKEVWTSLVAREVFKVYGFCKGLIVMLSFDDYDYQMLVLDPRRKTEMPYRSSNSLGQYQKVEGYC